MNNPIALFKKYLKPLSLSTLAENKEVLAKAQILVAYYYFIVVFLAIQSFTTMGIDLSLPNYSPLWPLSWASLFSLDQPTTVNIVRFFFVFSAILGAFFYKFTPGRALVFLGIWQMHAVESSFSHPNHEWYPLLYTSLIFVFLPSIWRAKEHIEESRKFLLVIWWAQALILLTYSMSGLWKFTATLDQFFQGQIHGFSKDAIAYQIADWLPRLGAEPILAPFFINNPVFGWPLYIGVHFLEAFAIWATIRPSLQKLWATGLILFHFGTTVTMGISAFNPSIIVLILLFFFSPFIPEKVSPKQLLYDLPIVGQVLDILRNRKR